LERQEWEDSYNELKKLEQIYIQNEKKLFAAKEREKKAAERAAVKASREKAAREKAAKGPARKTAQRSSKASAILKKGMDRGIKKTRKTTAQKVVRKRAPGAARCAVVDVVVEQPPSLPPSSRTTRTRQVTAPSRYR
jgi:hypothetical protein